MKIPTRELIPLDWILRETPDNLTLWFSSTKSHHGNYNGKPFILPKEIIIDDMVAEAIGLWVGDGDMNKKNKAHVGFTSKDLDIVTFMMRFLKKRLMLQNKDMTILVQYRHIYPDLPAIAASLHFPLKRILTRYSDRHRYPVTHIQINGVVFRLFFEKFVNWFLSSNFLEIAELRQGFLRGLFAAEGCVAVEYQENFIDHLDFALSSKEQDILSLLQAALEREGIRFRMSERLEQHCVETVITSWRNYLKCWQIGLFDRCERKKQKFLSIAKQSKVYGVLSQEDLDRLWHAFTQNELAEIIGSWQGNVCKMLQGKILFSLDQIRTLEQRGISLTIKKFRIGSLTELPYSEETLRLFCEA
jgi:hypothetical protein